MSYCVQLPRLQGSTEGLGDVCSTTRKLLENPRFAVAQKNLGTMLMEEPASRFRCWDFGSRQFGKSTIGALIITCTNMAVPYDNYSIAYPKFLF